MVICFLGCLDQIYVFTDIFLNTYLCMKFSMYNLTECLSVIRSLNSLNPLITGKTSYFFLIWQPPAFPYRHQYSIIGRFRLNHRVRDVDGCFPKAYRHQKYPELHCPKQSARFRSASSRCAASPHLRFQTQSLVSKLTVFSFVRYIASHYYHINNSTVNNLYSISLERR